MHKHCRFNIIIFLYFRAQAQAAARKQLALQKNAQRKSILPDGNVTFAKVTWWMLGAVASVAVYALYSSMDWDWSSWISHGS